MCREEKAGLGVLADVKSRTRPVVRATVPGPRLCVRELMCGQCSAPGLLTPCEGVSVGPEQQPAGLALCGRGRGASCSRALSGGKGDPGCSAAEGTGPCLLEACTERFAQERPEKATLPTGIAGPTGHQPLYCGSYPPGPGGVDLSTWIRGG